jgi:hypothetical protein
MVLIHRRDGEVYRLAASLGFPRSFRLRAVRDHPDRSSMPPWPWKGA